MTTIQYAPAGPIAAAFHASDAFVRGLKGPIGCLAGDTLVVTEQGPVRIDSVIPSMRVLSYDKISGQFLFVPTSASFPKGRDELYRVLTTHGEWRGAGHHRVLCDDGTYQQVRDLRPGQSLPQCSQAQIQTSFSSPPLSSLIGALRSRQTNASYPGHCGLLSHLYDLLLLLLVDYVQVFVPSHYGVPTPYMVSSGSTHTHRGQPFAPRPTTGFVPPLGRLLGGINYDGEALFSHISESIRLFLQSPWMVIRRGLESLVHKTYINSLDNGAIISVNRCEAQEEYWDLQVPNTNNYVTVDGTIHHNSGKSVTCAMDLVAHALAQPRGDDGWARSRAIIVRNTFPELKSTTIKTWLDWFPEDVFGKVRWDVPITHKLSLGDKREFEAVFLALDRPSDVDKLMSLETTWIWLNEVRTLPKDVLDSATGRVGRYPSPKTGVGAYHPCLIMDTNPPDDDHWYAKLERGEVSEDDLEREVSLDDWEFFQQPSGLSPHAENLNWLNQDRDSLKLPIDHPDRLARGRQYYTRLIAGKSKNWVKIYVEAENGATTSDRPVFPEYNDNIHASKHVLVANSRLPLYLAWDFGLTPACVIFQNAPSGQLRVLDEVLISEGTSGLEQFIDNKVAPFLAGKYPGYRIISLHDPAGVQRSQANEVTCRQVLKQKGLNPSSVSTNLFAPRRDAVAYFLSRLIDGQPAFMMSSTIKFLRKALNGDYKYRRVNVPGEERFKDVPDKTMSSHIAEALGYGCIHFHNPGRAQKAARVPQRSQYRPTTSAGY